MSNQVTLGGNTYPVVILGDKDSGAPINPGAVTLANGADVTQGAVADAAVYDPTTSASIVSLLKGLIGVFSGTDVYVNDANANGAFTLTLPAVAGKVNYVTGFEVSGVGATVANVARVDLNGLYVNPAYYHLSIPTLASGLAAGLYVQFTRPIPALAANTAISLVVPAFGAGNTLQSACLHGFYK